MEKIYPENCTVIRIEDDNPVDRKRANAIKYWSNAAGDLHMRGKRFIEENELPKPLQRAYRDLWEEDAGGACTYLVETDAGYGVAMILEYDDCLANECGTSMDGLFDLLLRDMDVFTARNELSAARFYALECSGIDDCHELAIVVPANMPISDFKAAEEAVSESMFSVTYTERTKHRIAEKLKEMHRQHGDFNIEIGEPEFKSPDYVDVPIRYSWRLNAWEKTVSGSEVLVRDSDGYWNLVCGFGFERFKA